MQDANRRKAMNMDAFAIVTVRLQEVQEFAVCVCVSSRACVCPIICMCVCNSVYLCMIITLIVYKKNPAECSLFK